MKILHNQQSHIIRHEALIFTFEHMVTLIQQMSGSQYHSMEIYINNCNHFHTHYLEAMTILSSDGFNDYIMKNDPQLYYHLQSMMLSFKMISNMINNLSEILVKNQQQAKSGVQHNHH